VTTATATTAFHYVMTVQTADGTQGTFSATVDLDTSRPGATRHDIYQQVRAYAAQQMGADRVTVLLFTIEPNQL
jgi:hypothetical protein